MPPPSTTETGFERVFASTAQFTPNRHIGNELYGDCPICGGSNKLYVNSLTGQWSCKAGKPEQLALHGGDPQAGNIYTWFDCWCNFLFREYDSEAPWKTLSKERGISVKALQDGGLVWNSEKWLLPVANENGTTVAIYRYPVVRKGKNLMWNLDGTNHFIYGIDRLKEYAKNCTIYICEGFWDAVCLQEKLDAAGASALALGIFGAGVLKKEWIDYFTGHPIVVCYDNDMAGQQGAEKILNTLVSVCTDLRQIVWPDDLESGYDVRDHFNEDGTLEELLSYVDSPLGEVGENEPAIGFDRPFGEMSFEREVVPVFKQWLHLTDDIETSIRIAFAVILSNQIHGEPLWVEIVAPPGGGKTEVLRATSDVANTYFLSTLKPAALVSGWSKGDPSILPKLRKKTLIVKDLTTLVSAPEAVKREVFGILRDAYDQEADYQYGQGVVRHYENIWFSMLAGVTPAVFADPDTSLGQRFLVYHSIKGSDFDGIEFTRRASQSNKNQAEMRLKLSEVTKQYLETKLSYEQVSEIPDEAREKIVYLAELTAKLRGVVERDKYNKDILKYPAQHEIATRLVQQLIRLAQMLSLLEEGMQFNSRVYQIVKRVALDTCSAFELQLTKLLVKNNGMTIDDLWKQSGLPRQTVLAKVDDMRRLDALRSETITSNAGLSSRTLYYSSDSVKLFWHKASLESKNGHKPHVNINDAKRVVKIKLRR